METSKINAAKIKAAGNNLSIIGYTMIVGIVISVIQVIYLLIADESSHNDLESIKVINFSSTVIYIMCAINIIANILRAGSNFKNCNEVEFNSASSINKKELSIKLNANETQTGEIAEGGIIVYSDDKGEHGLVCSNNDLGKANWDDAKKLCEGYNEGGFSDWRLPDRDELLLVYTLLHQKKGIGNFADSFYWSLTKYDSSIVWGINFTNSKQYCGKKKNLYNIRAVRTF